MITALPAYRMLPFEPKYKQNTSSKHETTELIFPGLNYNRVSPPSGDCARQEPQDSTLCKQSIALYIGFTDFVRVLVGLCSGHLRKNAV